MATFSCRPSMRSCRHRQFARRGPDNRLAMQPNYTYSLITMAAIGVGVFVSRFTRREMPLSRGQRWAISLGAICGGIIGAKLPFVLMDWDGMLSGTAWLENGKTITFGMVGGYFGVEAAKWAT